MNQEQSGAAGETGQRPEPSASARRLGAVALAGGAAVAAGGLLAAYSVAARRGGDGRDGTYPPLNTPKPVADGVWVVDAGPLRPMGVPVPLRMTVLRLTNGDLILHSPTPYSPDAARAVAALGRIAHLVAPNSAHWLYVADWQRHHPDAVTWAAPGLRERGQVRRSDVRLDHDLGERAPDAWAGEVDQGVVPGGLGFREVYLFHARTRTLVLTDLIENLEHDRLPVLARPLMVLAGASQGRPARHLRAVLRAGGEETAVALRALTRLAPDRVIFAHGRWFDERAAERLERAFRDLT